MLFGKYNICHVRDTQSGYKMLYDDLMQHNTSNCYAREVVVGQDEFPPQSQSDLMEIDISGYLCGHFAFDFDPTCIVLVGKEAHTSDVYTRLNPFPCAWRKTEPIRVLTRYPVRFLCAICHSPESYMITHRSER